MGDVLRFDAERLRILLERHQLLHRQRPRPGLARRLGQGARVVSSRSCRETYRRALLELAAERQTARPKPPNDMSGRPKRA